MSIKWWDFDVWPVRNEIFEIISQFRFKAGRSREIESKWSKYLSRMQKISHVEQYTCILISILTDVHLHQILASNIMYLPHCILNIYYIQTAHNFQVKCADYAFNFYVMILALRILHTAYCKVKVVYFFSTTHISIMFSIDGNFVLHKFKFMQPATIDLRFRLT